MNTWLESWRYALVVGRTAIVGALFAAAGVLMGNCAYGEEPTPEAIKASEQFFEQRVRPVLVEHCYKCHAGDRHKGGLRLDSWQATFTGGDSGPAVVPGDPDHSPLIQAIRYSEDFVQMPPTKKLSANQIADLTQWVERGAPWPGAGKEATAPAPKRSKEITVEDRAYWAFQPVKRPAVPAVEGATPSATAIDRFVLAPLAAKQLRPNPRANKQQLLRRAYFDLIGLPPTPDEMARFLADDSPQAWARVIDELLARPQYGERWARHWLDVVRYAQTNGYERDGEKPYAWRYRDYVVRAFNDDKPYDRFIVEQLAGDELDDANDDALIATGFYRLGVWDDEPDDPRAAEFDGLDDVMVATGASFLGLTLGCARCHDHRFDPIPQEDYYRLVSFFRNVRPFQNSTNGERPAGFLPLGDRHAVAAKLREAKEQQRPLEEQMKMAADKEKRELQKQLDKLRRDAASQVEWALGVREEGNKPTHVLIRGNAGTPGDEVQPAFLSVLGGASPTVVRPAQGETSGRRLALARWIASPENPLTARVMANRVWKHHFTRGLARTTSDFGRGGLPPTHPELLDYLAAELVDHGWSIKHLHRVILLSETYQRSSSSDNRAAEVDPGNDLFWRQNLHRLEAESIRDSILAVSGQLNPKMYGRGFFPHLAGEVLAGESRPGGGWEISPAEEQNRRSIYAFIKRSVVPPLLEGFDYANTASPLAERPVTTVAPQALMLLNDQFLYRQSQAFARRLLETSSSDAAAQVSAAYLRALGRAPSADELRVAQAFIAQQAAAYERLTERVTFVPDVPLSLHSSFRGRLQPADYLLGPRAGWSYYRGQWVGTYESIATVDARRGPFALWQGPAAADLTLTGELTLQNALEVGSVILRARAEGDIYRGYEVAFSPRDQSLALYRHAAEVTLLGDVDLKIPTNVATPFKIVAEGARVRVWLGNELKPLIDVNDPEPLRDAGRVGARSWGAAMSIDRWSLTRDGRTVPITAEGVSTATNEPVAALPSGWREFGGSWSVNAGVLSVEPVPGAKAIWDGVEVGDGSIEGEVMLRAPRGDGGLVVRVTQPTDGVDALCAYNINFQVNAIRLGKHQNNWKALARAPFEFGVDRWHHLRVNLAGGRIRVYVDRAEQPVIDYVDESPLPPGQIGVRTFGARLDVRELSATTERGTMRAEFTAVKNEVPVVPATKPDTPQERALAAFCLALFNLNEFVYVD